MTVPLRVAIVGAGAIGRVHARVVSDSADLIVVAIVDSSSEAAMALVDEITGWGHARPAVYGDLASSLSAESLDLVAVCTPSGLHLDLANAAVEAGCHVVIEKPLDVSLSRARSLLSTLDALGASQPVVSVISQHRFDEASVIVKDFIESHRLGNLSSGLASVSWWRSQGYYDSAGWRGTWAMDGGGALMNQGIHTLDLLVWFMGHPVTVQATTALVSHRAIEIEDVAAATITFASGSVGLVHATTAAYPGLGTRLQVMGDEGSAIIEDDVLTYVHSKGLGQEAGSMGIDGDSNQIAEYRDLAQAGTHLDPTMSAAGHARQYANVVSAIRGEAPLGLTVLDAVRALATVHAIYVSAQLGLPVAFDDVMAGKFDDLDLTVPLKKKSHAPAE